jgi:hypothetical protein
MAKTSTSSAVGTFSVSTLGGSSNRVFTTVSATAGNIYTLSAWVKTSIASKVRIGYELNGGDYVWSAAYSSYHTGSGNWEKLSFTSPALTSNTTIYYFLFNTDASIFAYFDGIQTEKSSSVTPYVDGSLGTGYSWTSTAHASTSNRTASTATTSATIDNTTGTIAFWFKSPNLDASAQCPFGPTDGDTNGGTLFGLKSTGVFLTHKYASGVTVTPQYTSTLTNNVWYHVTYTWNNTTLQGNLYVNGDLQQNVSYAQTITAGGYLQNIGTCTATGYSTFNGTLDDIRSYNRDLSSKEVRDLYNWAPGPIGYWKMDEAIGATANDFSSFGVNGTATGTSIVTGKFGKARQFTASDNVSATITDPGYSNTVEAWIYPVTSIASKIIITTGKLTIDASSKPVYGGCTGSAIPLNQWTYITAVSTDSTRCYIYQNGVKTATGTTGVTFGTSIGIGQSSFLGKIDEVKIYNYGRSQKQITEDMNAGAPAVSSRSGPLIYYKFDEGTGNFTANSGTGGTTYKLNFAASPNAPTWSFQNAKRDKSLYFGGSVFYATPATSYLAQTSDHTYSAWFNLDVSEVSSGSGHPIFGSNQGGGVVDYTPSTKTFRHFRQYTGGSQTVTWTVPTQYADGLWHYIAMTIDQVNYIVKLYLDGRYIGSNTITTEGYTHNNGAFRYLGKNYSTYWKGYLDEAKVYNYALTADEIKLDMNQGSAMVLGSISDTSGLSGGSVASTSASAAYCIPGDTATCNAPVAEWKFEEGTDQYAYDASANGATATLGANNSAGSDDPLWSPGKIGKALQFNGSTTFAKVTGNSLFNFDYNQDFTLSTWIKAPTAQGGTPATARRIIDFPGTTGYPFTMWFRSETGSPANKITVARYDGTNNPGINSTNTYNDNQWHYITFSKNGSTLSLYIDGKFDNSTNDTTTSSTLSDMDLYFGSSTGIASFFNGQIDNVRIYNYARTPAQVAWDYNRGAPIGWWKFDECQGLVAYDSSGNGINGTITIGATAPQTAVGTCNTAGTAWGNGALGKINSSLNFDGVDDYVDIHSSNLLSAFNGSEGSMSFWVKAADAGFWSDGLLRRQIYFTVNDNNRVFLTKTAANTLVWSYCAGGTCKSVTIPTTTIDWFHTTITWSKTNDKVIVYFNGFQSGTTQTGLGTFAGNLGTASIAAEGTIRAHIGQIDDVRLYNYPLTPAQIKQVYNGGAAVQFAPLTGTP